MNYQHRFFCNMALVFCSSLLLLSCGTTHLAVQETPDAKLQQKLEDLVRGFKGDVGIYVHNLETGQAAAIHPDTLFPTASMIKVSILCGLFDKINSGELKYNQELVYLDSMKYDDGVTGSFRDSTKIQLSELVFLMASLSDNTASLWLQKLAGTGAAINDWLEKNGFHQMRVNSRTPGRQANREVYGWGQTTPREMARIFTMIFQGRAVSPQASEQIFRILSKQYWDGEGLSEIPPTIHIATKNGAVNASKSETVLVNAPSGDYVYSVITKNQQDQRWEDNNEGNVLLRKVARTLWEHFEPDSRWHPQPGMERWTK